jgi:hypothetical protein
MGVPVPHRARTPCAKCAFILLPHHISLNNLLVVPFMLFTQSDLGSWKFQGMKEVGRQPVQCLAVQ